MTSLFLYIILYAKYKTRYSCIFTDISEVCDLLTEELGGSSLTAFVTLSQIVACKRHGLLSSSSEHDRDCSLTNGNGSLSDNCICKGCETEVPFVLDLSTRTDCYQLQGKYFIQNVLYCPLEYTQSCINCSLYIEQLILLLDRLINDGSAQLLCRFSLQFYSSCLLLISSSHSTLLEVRSYCISIHNRIEHVYDNDISLCCAFRCCYLR